MTLREFMDRLEKKGALTYLKAQVDPEWEVGAIMRKIFDKQGPAILFENVKGSHHSLVCGVLGTYQRYSQALGMESDLHSMVHTYAQSCGKPIPAVIVSKAACQSHTNYKGDIDLTVLPVPKWNPLDGGKYVGTLGVTIVKDPETGIRNAGIYRQQMLGKDRLGLNANQQIGIVYRKYQARGMAMPLAICIGAEPCVLAGSLARVPLGIDELGIAGALRGKPIELVKGLTVDVEIPASSEIVLEGFVSPNEADWANEGPFGEFTGYYAGGRQKKPVIELSAVTHQNTPIYQATLEGRPPSESNVLRTISYSAAALYFLQRAGHPGIRDVFVTDMGAGSFINVVSLERQFYFGHARQIIHALWGATGGAFKWVIVVDGDINPYDFGQVQYALATRVQPDRDIVIGTGLCGNNLDPSIDPRQKTSIDYVSSSKIGIDATTTFKGFEFGPMTGPTQEQIALVTERWSEYGLPFDA